MNTSRLQLLSSARAPLPALPGRRLKSGEPALKSQFKRLYRHLLALGVGDSVGKKPRNDLVGEDNEREEVLGDLTTHNGRNLINQLVHPLIIQMETLWHKEVKGLV